MHKLKDLDDNTLYRIYSQDQVLDRIAEYMKTDKKVIMFSVMVLRNSAIGQFDEADLLNRTTNVYKQSFYGKEYTRYVNDRFSKLQAIMLADPNVHSILTDAMEKMKTLVYLYTVAKDEMADVIKNIHAEGIIIHQRAVGGVFAVVSDPSKADDVYPTRDSFGVVTTSRADEFLEKLVIMSSLAIYD